MPEVEVDIQVYCESCGEGLCHGTTGKKDRQGRPAFYVEPCERCLDRARGEGHDEGYTEAEKKFNVEVSDETASA